MKKEQVLFGKKINQILNKRNYNFVKFLGNGYSGMVCEYIKNNNRFAIKFVYMGKLWKNQESRFNIKREQISLNNHIIKESKKCEKNLNKFILKGQFKIFDEQLLFFSVPLEGDLNKYLSNNNVSKLDKKYIICQMIYGIYCLHKINIVHGDIKPENFFVKTMKNNKLIIKIADFDGSNKKNKIINLWSPYFTPYYILERKEYKIEDDIFALGLSILFLFLNNRDFYDILSYNNLLRDYKYKGMKQTILNKEIKIMLRNFHLILNENIDDKNLILLIKKMLDYNKNKRITAEEIYNSKIIKSYCKEVLENFKGIDYSLLKTNENPVKKQLKKDVKPVKKPNKKVITNKSNSNDIYKYTLKVLVFTNEHDKNFFYTYAKPAKVLDKKKIIKAFEKVFLWNENIKSYNFKHEGKNKYTIDIFAPYEYAGKIWEMKNLAQMGEFTDYVVKTKSFHVKGVFFKKAPIESIKKKANKPVKKIVNKAKCAVNPKTKRCSKKGTKTPNKCDLSKTTNRCKKK